MQILQFAFGILIVSGSWRPFSWSSPFKRIIYDSYTTIIMLILSTFIISQFMNIVLNVDNPDEFTATIYMMLTVFMGFVKISNKLLNRKTITQMLKDLTENSFAPSDSHEVMIRQKYDRAAR